jgi:membrane-bound lytic murein transglycosylase D
MKTMLKSKMFKAGWIGLSSMIFMISPSFSSRAKDLFTDHAPVFTFSDSLGKSEAPTAQGSVEDCDPKEMDQSEYPRIKLNAAARKYVLQFIPKNREDLEAIEKRSDKYFSIIEPVLESYGIPIELKYLAVVESQLITKAKSRVGARGMWQLMPQTARELGLKCKGKNDERTHAYKSTVAAAKYLKALYNTYGDWLLVIAAYNSGPGYVDKAIKKSGSRNFWKLQRFLPAETRGHVKRYIGTHHYFQEEGSVTVLTKAETIEYNKAVEAFALKQKTNATEEEVAIVEPPMTFRK